MARSPATTADHDYSLTTVIAASSAGTLIEWYDFYLFGVLATFFAGQFFPRGNPTAAFLSTLAIFATGFAVRPFGAVVFGHVGDLVGRKYAFMVTITIMGLSTTAIGLVPGYATIGLLAPLIMLVLRLLQGLALGGEYGGAAVYVAEHAPDHKRGFYTSFIQTTATVGLFAALAVILVTRQAMSAADFASWGWRIPFLLSIILVALSLYLRWRLRETPIFARLKDSGQSSGAPLKESLGTGRNWKLILLALFGGTAGQAVVWYTGQFYALFFIQTVLRVPYATAYTIVAIALLAATPFFVLFGWLSDRVGRKPILLAGNLLAAITYVPIYMAMRSAVTLPADPKLPATDVNIPLLTILVLVQVIYVTMVYGPIAAFLVEFFPARIRYTSLSVPYHLGNGEFGGFTPLIASSIVAWATAQRFEGAIYYGLAYPIAVALITFIIGALFVPETKDRRIWDEVSGVAVEPGLAGTTMPAGASA